MTRWQWVIRLLTRRMWFRAALFCLFAVALALASALIGHTISYEFAAKIGSKSVDNLLNVLASSMLAVTTFSLTAMVSAYSGATSNITPRAVQLLVDDSTAQNALATFLGSFLFAIVGIVALYTGIYGEAGRLILFAGTVLVIAVIVVTFLRWIEHITRFGRVSDTIDRVELAATRATRLLEQPLRFGLVAPVQHPAGAAVIRHEQIGRITHIDVDQLREIAAATDTRITLAVLPGALIDPARPLAWTPGPVAEAHRSAVCGAITLANHRAFDQDPRFGLVVLAEIASRALSPAVNDAGTALAVLEAGSRVLAAMLRHQPDPERTWPEGVVVPSLAFRDLLEDLFRPIARDGAGTLEVGIRLQKTLAALAAIASHAREDCRHEARDALERATAALTSSTDRDRLVEVHARCWQPDN